MWKALNRLADQYGYASLPIMERFISEVRFADALLEISKKETDWAAPLKESVDAVTDAIVRRDLTEIESIINRTETSLSSLAADAKSYVIYCVGHGHIDMNWMWSWPETVSVTHDTFQTVLALMDEFPEFKYSQSQASVYEIIRQYNPDMLKRIAKRIKEGRWETTASQWVEGEKNIASGESMSRHLLYTRRFMKELFKLEPEDIKIDWEGDMFGHAATIPSILNRGGVSRYYMCRSGQPVKPWIFRWISPDGSSVLVFRDGGWYNGHISPDIIDPFLEFQKAVGGYSHFLYSYGIGDHGGGPTRRDILRLRDMNGWPLFPKLVCSTSDEYWSILEKDINRWPKVEGEINFEFTGCYTTQTLIKRANRKGELYCVEAETAAAAASRLCGKKYPVQMIRDAWLPVLFGQFHDILPGSGVSWTREYQSGLFQETAARALMLKTQAYRAIAGEIDTTFACDPKAASSSPSSSSASRALGAGVGFGTMEGGLSEMSPVIDGPRPFIAFNPTDAARQEIVNVKVWDADVGRNPRAIGSKRFVAKFPDGTLLPLTVCGTGGYWGHDYAELSVPVTVPAFGFAAFAVIETDDDLVAENRVTAGDAVRRTEPETTLPPVLENEHLRVVFDSLTGGVRSLIDKSTGVDVADPSQPMGVLETIIERPNGMSAWVIGEPMARNANHPVALMQRRQDSPLSASVTADLKFMNSSAKVTYRLKAGEKKLDIDLHIKWREIGTPETGTPALAIRFPSSIKDPSGVYEIPFGTIERTIIDGQELPTQRFAHISGSNGALTVLNDCKYGVSMTGSLLRSTLVRSSYNPDPLPEVRDHDIRFAVMPHSQSPSKADLIRAGAAFNSPLQIVATDVHPAPTKRKLAPLASCSEPDVIISSIRRAQDDEGLIITLFETSGSDRTVALDVAGLGRVASAETVDMMERRIKSASLKKLPVPAYGIVLVKVIFK